MTIRVQQDITEVLLLNQNVVKCHKGLLNPQYLVCSYVTSLLQAHIKDGMCFSISDYESLRIGGLVFAVVLFLMGIALIVSKCLTA